MQMRRKALLTLGLLVAGGLALSAGPSAATRGFLKGKVVTVEGTDHYADGSHADVDVTRCLNEELTEAGLAGWDRRAAPRDARLARLEAAARAARRGLWAAKAPAVATCKTDADCVLRLCCCRWIALAKGAPVPANCARRCRCARVPTKPKGVRCAGGRCEEVHQSR